MSLHVFLVGVSVWVGQGGVGGCVRVFGVYLCVFAGGCMGRLYAKQRHHLTLSV